MYISEIDNTFTFTLHSYPAHYQYSSLVYRLLSVCCRYVHAFWFFYTRLTSSSPSRSKSDSHTSIKGLQIDTRLLSFLDTSRSTSLSKSSSATPANFDTMDSRLDIWARLAGKTFWSIQPWKGAKCFTYDLQAACFGGWELPGWAISE
mmetsp:Transcript_34893/g.78294  ORF Transcript_34893/g.78294 Transcript_34893/m.78294 type:complete len:148 (+) Transcript_34893:1153-1596(+)